MNLAGIISKNLQLKNRVFIQKNIAGYRYSANSDVGVDQGLDLLGKTARSVYSDNDLLLALLIYDKSVLHIFSITVFSFV